MTKLEYDLKTKTYFTINLWFILNTLSIKSQTHLLNQMHASHTHLQHGEPSTCACAPSVCRRLDVSAAPPHTVQNLSEQPDGGQFGPLCLAHPDSRVSQTADAAPHSDHNTPAVAECMRVESHLCKHVVFYFCFYLSFSTVASFLAFSM